jgi:hypothetical protein
MLESRHVKTYELQLPWPKVLGNHAVKHTRAGGHYKVAEAVLYDALVAQILAGMGMGRLSKQKPLAGPLRGAFDGGIAPQASWNKPG